MKNLLFLFITLLSFQITQAQLLNENFNAGIPANWTQFSNTGVTWTANASLGTNSSGCAISDNSSSSTAGDAWLHTPFMDISSLTNPEIRFDFAVVQNNFVVPTISLWYDIGAGWVQLNSWTGNTTGLDFTPPLDLENVNFESIIYNLSSVSGNSNIRFSFGSDYTNGGYVLVDNVIIQETPPPTIYILPYLQDFESTPFLPIDWEFFGGNTAAAWEHHNSLGAYDLSSGCAYFDNFNNNVGGNFYGMRSVRLDMSATINPMLTFDVAYAKRNSTTSDRLGIWYSLNGTTGWTNLMNYENADLATAPDQNSYFTPSGTQWDTIKIDLSQFNGTPLIRFAFENNSSNGNVLYLDNVHFFEKDTTPPVVEPEPNAIISIDYSKENPLNAYLNSYTKQLHLSSNDKNQQIEELTVTNLMGQKIIDQKFTKENIDINKFKKGVYFITIKTNQNQFFSKKILID